MLKENRLLPTVVVIFGCKAYSSCLSSTSAEAKVGRSRFLLKCTNVSNSKKAKWIALPHRDLCYKQLTPVFVTYPTKRIVPQNSKNNDIT